MKYRLKNSTVKGFTLLEMMIVLGIIAVLTAVVVPISRGYYVASRVKTENANAKVIFNSLQTICQEFEFAERGGAKSVFYGDTKSGKIVLYVEDGDLKKVVLNDDPTLKDAGTTETRTLTNVKISETETKAKMDMSLKDALDNDNDAARFMQRVNRIYSNSEIAAYVAYIEDYSVKAVFAADHSSGRDSYYIGAYPVRMDEESKFYLSDVVKYYSYSTDEYATLRSYVQTAWN